MGRIDVFVSHRREDSRQQRDRICDHQPVASPPPVPGRRRPSWNAIVAAAMLMLVLLGLIAYVTTDRSQITNVRAPEAARNEIVNSIGMRLVLISAGEFTMGSPDSDPDAVPFSSRNTG